MPSRVPANAVQPLAPVARVLVNPFLAPAPPVPPQQMDQELSLEALPAGVVADHIRALRDFVNTLAAEVDELRAPPPPPPQ